MTQKLKPGEDRRQVVEAWIDEYGAQVYRLAIACHADAKRAQNAYIHTFVQAYRMFDALRNAGDGWNAVLAAAIVVCMEETPSLGFREAGVSMETTDCNDMGADEESLVEGYSASVAALSPELKSAVLAEVFSDGRLETLTRVLLLPGNLVQRRMAEALSQLQQTSADSGDLSPDFLRQLLLQDLAKFCVPDWLRTRVSQQVKATQAQVDAERRHHGPKLWVFATAATTILSLVAIGYGMQRGHAAAPASTMISGSGEAQAKGLPAPLQNLPGSVLAQFSLPAGIALHDFDHVAIGKHALYLSSMNPATDTWPTIRIESCDYADSGQVLQVAKKQVATLEMVPPMADTKAQSKQSAAHWTISNWSVQASDPWATVVVQWSASERPMTVTQVYALYLPSGKSSLVKNIGPDQLPESSVVATGTNRIVVQSSVAGKNANDNAPVIGLPIDVYALTGGDPSRALTGPTEIAAPFGLMVQPAITGDTLVFQGIAGQADSSTTNSTWYTLSWDDQLSRYTGPPLDGRPHWAVRGTSGKLWWCETTPDPAKTGNLQVLMAPMEDESTDQQAATETLSASVPFFTVSGDGMAWVQNTKGVTQLVVEAVQ